MNQKFMTLGIARFPAFQAGTVGSCIETNFQLRTLALSQASFDLRFSG